MRKLGQGAEMAGSSERQDMPCFFIEKKKHGEKEWFGVRLGAAPRWNPLKFYGFIVASLAGRHFFEAT